MRRLKTNAVALATALILATSAVAVAHRDEGPDNLPARLLWSYDGPTLVTPTGMSLYIHNNENTTGEKFSWQCTNKPADTTNENTTAFGIRPQLGYRLIKSCVDKFPPLVAGANARPIGDFSVVQRPEGIRQWAYRGFPLYTSVKDSRPGERNGAVAGGFGAGGGRAGTFRLAWMAVDLPTGLKLVRREEGLLLATSANDKVLYTPRGKRVLMARIGADEFEPIVAPAIASVNGDWSIVDGGAGRKQYAFRGKPLYAAPAGLTEREIDAAGGWDAVVVYKGPGRPAAIGKALTLLGEVYTDRKGMTLYNYNCNASSGAGMAPRFIPVACDDAGDPATFMASLCGSGQECARRWHPYLATSGAKPEGEFSIVEITYPTFTNPWGGLYPADAPKVKVWAFRGKPLFTFHEDEKPGDIWGNNIGGLWGSSFTAAEVPGRSAISFEF